MNINKINPATLKITDMRFADIDGAPKRCTLLKLYTNQGLVGYGEVRDASSRTYAAMLKSRILGENPCNVEKIFRRIKQFGGDSRQAGGVCAVELACMDLAGKAWGIPCWQLMGGKWRDEIRCYCDTDSEGGGRDMGKALKERMDMGFTFLKMDLGIELLTNVKDALIAPLGYLEYMRKMKHVVQTPHGSIDPRSMRGEAFELFTTAHGHTGIHITETGLDYLEKYMADVRKVIGWEVPIAIDHIGHIPYEDCVQLLQLVEERVNRLRVGQIANLGVVTDHLRAVFLERITDRLADAARRASHQRRFSRQIEFLFQHHDHLRSLAHSLSHSSVGAHGGGKSLHGCFAMSFSLSSSMPRPGLFGTVMKPPL